MSAPFLIRPDTNQVCNRIHGRTSLLCDSCNVLPGLAGPRPALRDKWANRTGFLPRVKTVLYTGSVFEYIRAWRLQPLAQGRSRMTTHAWSTPKHEHCDDCRRCGLAANCLSSISMIVRLLHPARGEVAERSKALRQGRNLFGGVGSNPTLVTFPSTTSRSNVPGKSTSRGARTHDHKVKSLALYRLS